MATIHTVCNEGNWVALPYASATCGTTAGFVANSAVGGQIIVI